MPSVVFSTFISVPFVIQVEHTRWKYGPDSLGLKKKKLIIQYLKSVNTIYLGLAYSSCAHWLHLLHTSWARSSRWWSPNCAHTLHWCDSFTTDKVVKVKSQPLLNRDPQGSPALLLPLPQFTWQGPEPWLKSRPSAPSQIFAITAGRSHLTSQWRQLGSSLLADKTS